MIILLRHVLVFGILFYAFNCNAMEQPCRLGAVETTLPRLNEIHKSRTGHYLKDGCVDHENKFPVQAITFNEGPLMCNEPAKNMKQFVLDLFRACTVIDYKLAATEKKSKLPTLQVEAENFEFHIFVVIYLRNHANNHLPEEKVDTRRDGSRYHASFFWIDNQIARETQLSRNERADYWQKMGFNPAHPNDGQVDELQLPIRGKPKKNALFQ